MSENGDIYTAGKNFTLSPAVTNLTSDKDTVNETVPAQNCSDTSVIHTLMDIFRTSTEFAESDAVFAKRTISFLFSLRCLLLIQI